MADIRTTIEGGVGRRPAEEMCAHSNRREATVREEITRPKDALIALSGLIPCGGEISNAVSDNAIDCLSNDSVLEHRFGKVKYIVNNDLCPSRCKGLNV